MILVTGDVVLNHNIYQGERLTPDAPGGRGSHYKQIPGGALLSYKLLEALAPGQVLFGLSESTPDQLRAWSDEFQKRALWRAVGELDKEHWALDRQLGYGQPGGEGFAGTPAPGLDSIAPEILVIDDAAIGFREAETCWPRFLSEGHRPETLNWVVLKASRPLDGGKLWSRLTEAGWRQHLIVIVSADQLRDAGLRISGGLSWETCVEDIVRELELNRPLRDLVRHGHLIVTMRSDAALWIGPSGNGVAYRLVFDRERCEGEWEDTNKGFRAHGFLSAVTASLAWSLLGVEAEANLTPALATGLSAARFLGEHGHGPADRPPHFPFAALAQHIRAETNMMRKGGTMKYGDILASVSDGWTILGDVSPWHRDRKKVSFEPARRVALFGPGKLPSVPRATFGKLQTVDRREIDSLRALRQLMLNYRDGLERKQPLCLAVFGAPGSGKSFGLKQIAAAVFGENTPVPEFNLSQFSGPSDLIGAFHQVRDKVLSGETPVVFWDEFDSENLKWLQYFLAPMQDGVFQEEQVTHYVGKAVFVFAGGTSDSFKQFRGSKDADFKLKKGPDFVSRLAGYLDVAGPNPRSVPHGSTPDVAFPVRRALVIRNVLKLGKTPLQIEYGLLKALLTVRYRNGARSLDKLVTLMKDRAGDLRFKRLTRAHLPPDEVLALHVEDKDEFYRLSRKYTGFYEQAGVLAEQIHDDYVKKLPPDLRAAKPHAKPWKELSPEIQDSNLAAALRMPEILELVGLALEEGGKTTTEALAIMSNKLDLMAEAEHGGWEEQKRIDGWTYSPRRDEDSRRHNLLVPYSSLPEEVKEYDRNTIRNYPAYAGLAGFGISCADITSSSSFPECG